MSLLDIVRPWFTRGRYSAKVLLPQLLLAVCGTTSVFGSSIDGVVTDMQGQPLRNAAVHLVFHKQRYWTPEDLNPLQSVQTDSGGRFWINAPDVTTASLALLVFAPGREKIRVPLRSNTERLSIQLGPGVDLTGVVTDEKDVPIAGANVGPLMVSETSERAGAERIAPQWAKTQADGTFRFSHVAPDDDYVLTVSAPGFQSVNVPLQPGRVVQVKLLRGGSSLGGELYSPDMLPSQHADTPVVLSESGTVLATRADHVGRFSITGIPPGDYSLTAMPTPPRTAQALSLTFPENDGTSVALEITGGYYVEGIALDWDTSTPAAMVPLQIAGLSGVTDVEGRFRIGPFYRPGFIEVTVPPEVRDWRLFPESGENPPPLPEATGFSDLRGVQVRLKRNRTMQVRVLNFEVSTQPLTLHMLSAEHGERQVPLTTSPLTVNLEHLGKQWAYAKGGNLVSDLRGFEITSSSLVPSFDPPGEVAGELVLYLQPQAQLEGVALRQGEGETTGTPVADCLVRLVVPETFTTWTKVVPLGSSVTDMNGRFRFSQLPAAVLECRAITPSRGQEISQRVDLQPGKTGSIQLLFLAGEVFAGTVVDDEGNPVAGAQVRYYVRMDADTTRQGETVTDAGGRFVSDDIAGRKIDLLQIMHPEFVSREAKGIALPVHDARYQLRRSYGIRTRVDAPENTVWLVSLLRARPWGEPPYADQLMGQEVDKLTLPGGKPGEFKPSDEATYFLVARGPLNGLAVSAPIEWNRERAARNELVVLNPAARGQISGSVVDAPAGEPIRILATNTWLPERSAPDEREVMASEGRFTLSDLLPGNYLLVAEGVSYAATASNVLVPPDAKVDVTLKPFALNDVKGTVLLHGRPVAGATVQLLSQVAPGFGTRETKTDAQGQFSFSALSPDTYLVRASTSGGREEGGSGMLRVQRTVRIGSEEEEIMIDLDLTPPSTVSFSIPSVTGEAAAAVALTNRDTGEVVQATGEGTQFTAPVGPGLYQVSRGDVVLGNLEVSSDGGAKFIE